MSTTPEQSRAISARGEVLVSASAGAGKTTVMIQRLVDILQDGGDLDGVLAVTFTKKAATQMKEKLRKELIKRLDTADTERRERLRLQLNKVNTADISTIHSFCARLIRTYFYALNVDASFEVLADGAEANTLRRNAMNDLFEELYAEKDPDLYLLLTKLRKKRSDGALKEMLLDSYDEVRQRPDYLKNIENACNFTYCEQGFAAVAKSYAQCLGELFKVLADAVEEFMRVPLPELNGGGYFAVLETMRDTLREYSVRSTPFGLPKSLNLPTKPNVKPATAEYDARFTAVRDRVKKRYAALVKDVEEEQVERAKLLSSGEVARAYFSVLRRFDRKYSEVKHEEGKLDYGDLEHLALSLLRGNDCDEDVRAGVRAKYKFVFVDEYQDVNPIQDEIISAVASEDVFCVGDLKQAIYGFRGSSSRFFAEKCSTAGERGEYVVLPDNFRSSKRVIEFVNDVFSDVMKPPFTEFDYANEHAMRGGSRYAEGCDGIAEVCLFDKGEGDKKQAEGVYTVTDALEGKTLTAEGSAVLALVEEALRSEYYDPDEGKLKKVQPGDICVLTRKKGNASAQGIMRALTTKYPVAGANEANICDRPEIIRLLNVLSYLDNAEQDIPLVTSLLSPLGGFTEGELATIRIYGDEVRRGHEHRTTFGSCCKSYAKHKDDYIANKLNAFYGEAERLRALARNVGASWLIDEIMRLSDFASTFDTDEKLTALRTLQGEAFGPSGELYLGAFLQKVRAADYEITAPASLASDCIKVMTMHASKGLEFPVVIVADITVSFKGDEREEMPYGDDFGFAPRHFDEYARTYSNTVLRKLYKLRTDREELSNEINLFYVACTRAKYALHVLTSEAKGYDFVQANFTENYADLFDVKSFAPRLLPVERGLGGNYSGARRIVDDSRADGETLEMLTSAVDWQYPYATGADLPVKSSASRLISEREGAENAVNLFEDEFERSRIYSVNGTVATDGAITKEGDSVITGAGKVSSADAGIAYHRFLELCDFSVRDGDGVAAQLEKWLAEGKITPLQRDILSVDELTRILSLSALGELSSYRLFREREFVCRLPSADYRALRTIDADGLKGKLSVGEEDGNGVIVQGAIDLLAVEYVDGRAVSARIIDYKYSGHSDGEIRQKYAPQLALYRSVVCRIYGLDESKVTTTILNIRACRQIDLN